MPLSKPDLWQQLSNYSIDDGKPKLRFVDRLARENNWSVPFAIRVEKDYKRFLYLTMAAGHAVTPSDQVDRAWHLHLTYSRSYWDRLCKEILGEPLHHDPTRGGKSERKKFWRQYQKTLNAYEREFDQKPSKETWPEPKARFAAQEKPVLPLFIALWMTILTPVIAVICSSDFTTYQKLTIQSVSAIALTEFFGVLAFVYVLVPIFRHSRSSSGGCSSSSADGSSGCGSDDCGGDSGCGSGCGGGCGGGD